MISPTPTLDPLLVSRGPEWGLAAYRLMRLIRSFDEAALQARIEGSVYGTMHPYIGQEAIATGVCAALEPTDRIISNHRGHGHCLAKGADPNRMFAELFGRATGYCKGKGGSMHIADFDIGMLGANGIVGAGLPIAAGSALASQLDGRSDVTVAFFGDGATGQGVFHESMNLAAVWRLPMIWVCENNMYSVDSRLEDVLPTTDVHELVSGFGIPSTQVDGNDLMAVHAAAVEAVARAREGAGPSFIEARTYRWGVHSQRAAVTPENRPSEELEHWRARDPIVAFGERLAQVFGIDPAALRAVDEEVGDTISKAVRFAEESPYPQPEDALNDLWADDTAAATS